jgi:hypothetical protein
MDQFNKLHAARMIVITLAVFVQLGCLSTEVAMQSQMTSLVPEALGSTIMTPTRISIVTSTPNYVPTAMPQITPVPTIVLVPVDQNGGLLVNYQPTANECVIYVYQSTQGINIYPDLDHTFNENATGTLRADDGVVQVQSLVRGPGPEPGYRWALIQVRGISGWVHADPPWTVEPPACAENAQKLS